MMIDEEMKKNLKNKLILNIYLKCKKAFKIIFSLK